MGQCEFISEANYKNAVQLFIFLIKYVNIQGQFQNKFNNNVLLTLNYVRGVEIFKRITVNVKLILN